MLMAPMAMACGSGDSGGTDGAPGEIDELYDLVKDPWELTNVAHLPENSAVISHMRALLAGWMIETEDPTPVEIPDTLGRAMPR